MFTTEEDEILIQNWREAQVCLTEMRRALLLYMRADSKHGPAYGIGYAALLKSSYVHLLSVSAI